MSMEGFLTDGCLDRIVELEEKNERLKQKIEKLELENKPLKSPFDPRFDHLNRGNQDDM